MKKYKIQTFGCQMNYSDSERIVRFLEDLGFCSAKERNFPDIFIINTCSVRQKSEDKAIGFIKNIRKKYPHCIIGVTGCMIRQTGDRSCSKDILLQNKNIDFVFRIADILKLPEILKKFFPSLKKETPKEIFGSGSLENYFQIIPKKENKFQAFVPITQGCDKFCAYCIVPLARGRESSRHWEEILEECMTHVRSGAKEITLLGQNVNSYKDGKVKFSDLLRKIDTLVAEGLSRTRFTSPHPQDFTDDVIETLSEMKTSCPYIHLPAQHGSDRILKLMNRHYTADHYAKIVEKIRKKIPNVAIATDIIVGFPGETEEDFKMLCDFAKKIKFDFSYTAIFSPRKGTPAAERISDFVPLVEKRRRFAEFEKIVKESSWKRRDQEIGNILEILVETSVQMENGLFLNGGRSREFFECYFLSGRNMRGKETKIKIEKRKGFVLSGVMI